MEKFQNYHQPERHYTHGPGAKWIEKPVVGFGCPYSDRASAMKLEEGTSRSARHRISLSTY
jgi:hypothetical protein